MGIAGSCELRDRLQQGGSGRAGKRNLADRPEKEESKAEAAAGDTASKSDSKKDAGKDVTKPAPESKRTTVPVRKQAKRKAASRGGLRKAKRRRA